MKLLDIAAAVVARTWEPVVIGLALVALLLAGGETVTKRKTRRYSRIADMPVSMLARAIRERTNQ